MLDGYEEIFDKSDNNKYESGRVYEWNYGKTSYGNVSTYKVEPKVAAKSTESFGFRTAESFLKSINTKKNEQVDLDNYKEGTRVFHKKFGEGVINYVEAEGDDLKVDITFEKSGHKRLMAKFAGLEIL